MGFPTLLVLIAIAYLVWRVSDQLPDLIFRLSEVQRDIAEIRRHVTDDTAPSGADAAVATNARKPPANLADSRPTGAGDAND